MVGGPEAAVAVVAVVLEVAAIVAAAAAAAAAAAVAVVVKRLQKTPIFEVFVSCCLAYSSFVALRDFSM